MKHLKTLGILSFALFTVACSDKSPDLPSDGESASFGGEPSVPT